MLTRLDKWVKRTVLRVRNHRLLAGATRAGATQLVQPRRSDVAFTTRRKLADLTPGKMLAIFNNADEYLCEQILLAYEMEESDTDLAGTLHVRRSAVRRLIKNIQPGDPDDERSVQAAEALDEIVNQGWWGQMEDELLRAIWQQHAAVEMLYGGQGTGNGQRGTGNRKPGSRLWTPTGFRAAEPERYYVDDNLTVALYRDLATRSSADLVYFEPGTFIHHTHQAIAGQPGRRANVRTAAKLWYFAHLNLTGWGKLIDRWGQPFTHFQYDPNAMSTAELRTLIDTFLQLADEMCVATPQGVQVDLKDPIEHTPNQAFAEFYAKAMSRFLLGQETAQHATAGQETGATVQGQVRDDLRDEDAEALDDTLATQFIAPWCAWNFGLDVAPPTLRHVAQTVLDQEQRGRVFQQAQNMGLPIKREQVYEELGIETPAEDDELLVPPAAQTVPAAGEMDNVAFEKRMLELIGQGQMTREMLVNLLDVQEMIRRVGLPLYNLGKGANAEPWLPILAPPNMAEVTGEVTRDSEGDIVGGDVEETPSGLGWGNWGIERPRGPGVEGPREERTAPAAPVPAGETVVGEETIEELGLNGAQVKALQELLQSVSDGTQSGAVVRELVHAAFPMMDTAVIERMVAAAEAFEQTRPELPAGGSKSQTSEPELKAVRGLSHQTLTALARQRPDIVRQYRWGFLVKPRAVMTILAGGLRARPQSSILHPQSFARSRALLKSSGTREGDRVQALAGLFEGHLQALRSIAERAANEKEFRAGLDKIADAFDTDTVAEAIHQLTFAGYAAGRLREARGTGNREQGTGDRQQMRRDPGSQFPVPSSHILASGNIIQAGFDAAVKALRSREIVSAAEFEKLAGLNRRRAFSIAGEADKQVIADVRDALAKLLGEGGTYRDFVDSLNDIMEQRGWSGVTPSRARLIHDQNTKMAYTAGRYDQAKDAGVRYWRKLRSTSREPRPEHAAYDGKIFRFDEVSPPPWDFGCNCPWEVVYDDEVTEGDLARSKPDFRGQTFQFNVNDYFGGEE
jgi:SPP1 gp7 family putative phage head morphogenesis protein